MKNHVVALRWFCRITGSAIVALTVLSIIIRPPDLASHDSAHILELCAYFTIIAGFVAGWKHEGLAGTLVLSGYTLFSLINGILFLNWILALFPLIGFMYIYVWWRSRPWGNRL